jgi:hypothetical protein
VLGNVKGKSYLQKFGSNPDVGTSYESIWTEGGLYDWAGVDAAEGIVKVSSSSTDDDVAGTGALTCTIYGLDTDGVEQNEVIILTGQTAVNSANEYSRVYRIIVNTAGSGLANAGVIYVGTGTITTGKPAVVWALADTGLNQTLMAIYTVPTGKTLYITDITVSTNSNKGAVMDVFFKPVGELFQIKRRVHIFDNAFYDDLHFPLKIESGTDIDVRAKATASGASFSSTIDGWLE